MMAGTFGEEMDNFEALTKEYEKHKGELVLDSTGQETVMLVGFHDDKDDYYWEFLHWDGEAIKSSCVCSFVPLKEYLPKKIYQNLCDVFYINVHLCHLGINRARGRGCRARITETGR